MRILSAIFAMIIVIFLIIANVLAAPEQSAECFDENLKMSVKRGEVAHPEGRCLRLTCPEDGPLRVEPCELAIPPNCPVVDGDPSQKFPGCCPTVKCE